MENSTRVPQKLKTELPPDPGIPGLGIYPEELNSDLEEQRAPQVHCGIIQAAREGAKWPRTLARGEGVTNTYTGVTFSREKGILPRPTPQISLESTMPRGKGQILRGITYRTSLKQPS